MNEPQISTTYDSITCTKSGKQCWVLDNGTCIQLISYSSGNTITVLSSIFLSSTMYDKKYKLMLHYYRYGGTWSEYHERNITQGTSGYAYGDDNNIYKRSTCSGTPYQYNKNFYCRSFWTDTSNSDMSSAYT